jgi:tetratricopeptide (TPR) repeat protein
MGTLAFVIVVIGVVGLVAAILNLRDRGRQGPVATVEQPTVESLLKQGREAFVEKRWLQAASAFEQVLALEQQHQEADDGLKQARLEQRNQGTLEAARQALAEEHFEEAVDTLRTIPSSSVYAKSKNEILRRAKQHYGQALVVEARRLLDEEDREAARARVEAALEQDPRNEQAKALKQQLGQTDSTKIADATSASDHSPPDATGHQMPLVGGDNERGQGRGEGAEGVSAQRGTPRATPSTASLLFTREDNLEQRRSVLAS